MYTCEGRSGRRLILSRVIARSYSLRHEASFPSKQTQVLAHWLGEEDVFLQNKWLSN